MTSQEIRQKFLQYFESKRHKIVSSSSLLPTDASVLFTTAGMQQFKSYYTGAADPMKDFGSLDTASIQKCIRTSDIDEVGDDSHLTFFEMLGNFSFGGYWKKEAIQYAHEFITQKLGLKIDYVTIFEGHTFNKDFGGNIIPADRESEEIWKSLDPDISIKEHGRADNFWGPTGEEGPCGPTTEIYVNGVEVWNIVFNEYYQHRGNELGPLETKGIDTGMGLERLAMMVQDKKNIFETDLFSNLIYLLPKELPDRSKRIVADHVRAIAFLTSDGVKPSNKEQGYVLRRLMRRIVVHNHLLPLDKINFEQIFTAVIHDYKNSYPDLNLDLILSEFLKEQSKFMGTLQKGLQEVAKLKVIDDEAAFRLYESFGLPFEVIQEVGALNVHEMKLTREGFEAERKRHQEISRAGAEKKFGGHGIVVKEGDLSAENQEEMQKKTRLHTATHIVVAALEKVLGQKLPQAGSDITAERLRFDFAFPRKITPEELKQAQDIANDIVDQDLPVSFEEMDVDEAFKSGAAGAFKHKYGNRVKVYSIGKAGEYFSRELCGGPHVTHTGEVGHITITKEESVSGGNRRIRATVD